VGESKYGKRSEDNKCLTLQFEFEGKIWVAFLGSGVLIDQIDQVPKDEFPFEATVVEEMNWYKFV
jgi:hypothetical protein